MSLAAHHTEPLTGVVEQRRVLGLQEPVAATLESMLYDTSTARVETGESRMRDQQDSPLQNHGRSPGKHQRKHSRVMSGGVPDNAFVEMDPSERYGRFDEELGRGACKIVYKAFDTQEGREVAWNKVDLRSFAGGLGDGGIDNEEHDRILAEIRVLRALKHKNIMSFYKWWYNEKKGQVNFISEMFASGTLRQYRKRHRHLGDDVLKHWGWQILSGLVYLHGHNPPIVHRDLKCDNIFINGADGVVKIGDLGLATMLHGRTAPQSVLGTPEFMAPELYDEFYDDRVDVYAFGMVMLELATLEYPYSECSNAAQIYRKVSLGVRPAGLQKVSCRELADFINTCIAPLEQRPRSRQLLKHPYFASIRSTLHPSKTELLLSAYSSQNSSGRGPAPKSSNAILQNTRSKAPASSGSLHHSSSNGEIFCRSLSASPTLLPHQDPHSAVLSDDLMRQIVESKDPRKNDGNSTSSTATPPPSHADGMNQAVLLETRSPNRERATSPFINNTPPNTGPKRRRGVCRCAATNRCFEFAGRYREDRKQRVLSLRLKIMEPDDSTRTIEFEFDITSDTATSVATEMVAVLELSPEDAQAISAAMESEITNLLPSLEGQASCNLAQAAAELQQELRDTAIQHASGEEVFGEGSTEQAHGHMHGIMSGTVSMASFHSVDSSQSAMQSAVASPDKGAKSCPLQATTEDFYGNLRGIGSGDVFSKVHCLQPPSGTPPGSSGRPSFEERLSPNGDLLREDSSEKRSLNKLYANLEEVAYLRNKSLTPPLQKKPSQLQSNSSRSGPPSLLDGEEDKSNKGDKLQQAMNALKVVESRSLDSLVGNGSSNSLRGIPMASSKVSDHLQGSLTTNSSRESNIDSILLSHPSMDVDSQVIATAVAEATPNNNDSENK